MNTTSDSIHPASNVKFCPACGQPLRIERQPNYRRIDGKLTEVAPIWLHTCDNPECPFSGFTVVTATFSDPAELRRYGLEFAPYDATTGRYKSAWERYGAYSNTGKDTPRSRWERQSYRLHAGKAS